MLIPNITPDGLAREIAGRILGSRAVAINDMLSAFRDFPAMYRVMSVLLNPMPRQLITSQDLNSARTELLSVYNRNTKIDPNISPN